MATGPDNAIPTVWLYGTAGITWLAVGCLREHMDDGEQDYFTIKVCSVGKSDRRRDVTQENLLRPS